MSNRAAAAMNQSDRHMAAATTEDVQGQGGVVLDGSTRGKFLLFAIPVEERVEGGPVMRGLIETEQGRINVAGWKRVARDSGNDYLSLKVGNTKPRDANSSSDDPDEWQVGPFYGRLFKEVNARRGTKAVRYFGFIENAEKVGEDAESGRGVYETRWQLQIKASPEVSNDGRTPYIGGMAGPAGVRPASQETALPF
jgi:hypothetical protein